MEPFATFEDLEARHPAELITLAADESSGVRDDGRIERALIDAESRDTVRMYAMDVALYRISLSFARGSEAIAERYRTAIKRLEGIASGKGALSFDGGPGGDGGTTPAPAAASPNQVIIDVPERMFSRRRMGGL